MNHFFLVDVIYKKKLEKKKLDVYVVRFLVHGLNKSIHRPRDSYGHISGQMLWAICIILKWSILLLWIHLLWRSHTATQIMHGSISLSNLRQRAVRTCCNHPLPKDMYRMWMQRCNCGGPMEQFHRMCRTHRVYWWCPTPTAISLPWVWWNQWPCKYMTNVRKIAS